MTPYYQDDAVTIYHGDCRGILPAVAKVSLVLTDPPYGVAERTDRGSKGRGNLAAAKDFPAVYGDDAPFDPSHLLGYQRVILWGANHFANVLPPSPSWIVWDKLDGLSTAKRAIGFDDNADVELAWTNCGGPARLIPHRWKGMLKASERAEERVHPTQKPVWLMERLIEVYAPVRPDLFGGRRAVGIEIEERYCEIAARRMGQEVLDFGGAA